MSEFEIKKDETLNKTIRMKSSLINEITNLANQYDVSFNNIVVQMCEFALLHLPNKNKVDQTENNSNKNNA